MISCVSDYQQRERARLKLEQEGLARRRAALAQMDREAQAGLRDAEVGGHMCATSCVYVCVPYLASTTQYSTPTTLPSRQAWERAKAQQVEGEEARRHEAERLHEERMRETKRLDALARVRRLEAMVGVGGCGCGCMLWAMDGLIFNLPLIYPFIPSLRR